MLQVIKFRTSGLWAEPDAKYSSFSLSQHPDLIPCMCIDRGNFFFAVAALGERGSLKSTDGDTLITCSFDRSVRIYSLKEGVQKKMYLLHTTSAWSVALGAGERYFPTRFTKTRAGGPSIFKLNWLSTAASILEPILASCSTTRTRTRLRRKSSGSRLQTPNPRYSPSLCTKTTSSPARYFFFLRERKTADEASVSRDAARL